MGPLPIIRSSFIRRFAGPASRASALAVALTLGGAAVSGQSSPGRPPAATDAAPTSPLSQLALSVREKVRLQSQVQRARERLKVLGREADGLAAQQRTVLGELRQLEVARERHAAEEEAARAAGTLAEAALADTRRELTTLEAEAATRQPIVRARVTRLYRTGHLDSPRYWVRSADLARTARGWRLLAAVGARDREVLAAAIRDRDRLQALRRDQQAKATEARELMLAARDARAAANRAVAQRRALLARLDQERDLAARLVGELQQAEERLSNLLSAPPDTAVRTSAAGTDAASTVLPLRPFKGDLEAPVAGDILSRFGHERDARFGTVLPRNGIEIGAAEATPVRAVHEGRVVFSDRFAGLGLLVIVEHAANAFSLYGHLGGLAVKRGDAVARGATIGAVGRTPTGTEAVYFELRIDGQPVDPLEWVKPVTNGRSRP